MRILIVARRYPVVSQTFILLHVKSLLKLGHSVTIMAEPGDSSLLESIKRGNDQAFGRIVPIVYPRGNFGKRFWDLVRQIPLDFRSLKSFWFMVSDYVRGRTAGAALAVVPYASALRQVSDWDIVHVHFGNLALPVAQLCDAGFINVPVIVTFHGTDLNEIRPVSNCQLFARVFQSAQLLTVGTKHMAKHLEECNISSEKYKVIPMGIDLPKFNTVTLQQRQRDLAGTRLVTIGRLVEFKGIEYAIRAVAELRKKWPDITLDVIGDGPLRGSLEQLCGDLDVASAVKFRGALEHEKVLSLLQESDIYIQPGIVASDGTREGQGVAVAEAQAFGLPVVASRVGGIPEIVIDGETAYLVEQKDVIGLIEKISLLICDNELRERMGAAGQVFVEQSLNQEVLAHRWVEIYNDVLTKKPGYVVAPQCSHGGNN